MPATTTGSLFFNRFIERLGASRGVYPLIEEAAALPSVLHGPTWSYEPGVFTKSIEETIARHPDRIALVFGEEALSYRALGTQIRNVRRKLASRGIARGRSIGLLMDPCIQMITIYLAIMANGCTVVPLSNKEASTRINFCLGDSECAVLITQQQYTHHVHEYAFPTILSKDLFMETDCSEDGVRDATPESEAYILYTSGTTGAPKGVRITHKALDHFGKSISIHYEASPEDRVLYTYSPSVDTSLEEISLALFNGGTLFLANEKQRHSPELLQKLLTENRITIAILPLKLAAEMNPEALPDLRLVVFGGEPIHAEVVNRWQTNDREVYNGYGPTEATVAVTQMLCKGHFTAPPAIGAPMRNHVVAILDPDTRLPVALGQIGEISIAGPGLSEGYLGRDTLTAQRFIRNTTLPSVPYDRFYMTGDLGSISSDGLIAYHGRTDQQVKISGYRVELSEIENVLITHPLIDFASVLAEPSSDGGKLTAFLKCRNGDDCIEDYWPFMQRRLPVHMIPRTLKFIADIPLTRSGKVDRAALRDLS